MNQNSRIELLGKLASEKEISSLLKSRKKDFIFKNVEYELKDVYLNDEWLLDKELKASIRVKKPKPHDIEFEDHVWCLFAQLGYKFLNRDRHFHLPYDKSNLSLTQQIDVFAIDDETILLIECKSSQENKRGDFKKELEAMKGKMEGLRKSLQYLFPGTKHKVKFILATQNLEISSEDQKRLESIGGVHFNEENIDYFFGLRAQIGVASKYQLLGYLFDGQEIPEMDNRVPAVEGEMGGHKYYSFSLEPSKILKMGYVLHRNKANINMMPTYQRLIKKSRLKSVHDFIEGGGYFPNSVVLSIDTKKSHFEKANTQVHTTLSSVGILHLPKRYRSAFIIDGQHRLYGYSDSVYKDKNTIPVVAFINLSREEQVKLFMQINENQKSVSKDLRNTLNADLLWTSESYLEQMRALCSRVSIYLGEHRGSPLFDKISIGEDKKIITTQAIENAIKRAGFLGKVTKWKIEELGSIYNGNLDETFERLTEYLTYGLNYVAENIPYEWELGQDGMLVINKGIYGVIMILGDLLIHLEQNGIEVKKSSIKNVFSEVKSYLDPVVVYIKSLSEASKLELKTSYGAGGETKYWRTFQWAIQDTYQDFCPSGLTEYFEQEEKKFNEHAIRLIRDIETFFKNDFKEKLQEFYGKKWFEKGVPPKFADKATIDALTKNREVEEEENEVEPWDCLTIIAYRDIALKNWQHIFEKDYTRPGEEKGNISKDEKTKWMVKLERIRNQNFHSYSVTEQELGFLEELHDWLIKKEVRNKFQE
jgi:DNA sulfur modification protein DndB